MPMRHQHGDDQTAPDGDDEPERHVDELGDRRTGPAAARRGTGRKGTGRTAALAVCCPYCGGCWCTAAGSARTAGLRGVLPVLRSLLPVRRRGRGLAVLGCGRRGLPVLRRRRRLLAVLGCVLAVAGGRLFAGLGGVRVRRRDWRDAHGRSFAWRSDSDTGNSFLPCPQHGLRPPYRGPAPARIIPERYSRRACWAAGRRAGSARVEGAGSGLRRRSDAGQARPRREANHAWELGSHISTVATRLMVKLGQLPAAPAVGRAGVEDGKQQRNAGDDREGEAGPLVAFLHLHGKDDLGARQGPVPPAPAGAPKTPAPGTTARSTNAPKRPTTPPSRPSSPLMSQIQ